MFATSVSFSCLLFNPRQIGKQNIAKGISVCSPQGPRNHSENYEDRKQPICSTVCSLLPTELVMGCIHSTPITETIKDCVGALRRMKCSFHAPSSFGSHIATQIGLTLFLKCHTNISCSVNKK